jgi:cysteine-rich repeat protein
VWVGNEAYVEGKLGKAFLFDGSSYVTAPVDYARPMTVDLWVRATDPVPPLFASALSSGNMPAPEFFQFDSNGSGNWRILQTSEGSFGAIDNMAFQHLAMTYDGAKMVLYFQGAAVGEMDAPAGTKFSVLKLGVYRGGDVGSKAAVDEVHIWKRALTAAEIAELHSDPKAKLCPTTPACGDGTTDTGETCDDHNTATGDGCTIDCKKECSALHFNGGADKASAANSAGLHTSTVTLAGWYKGVVGAGSGTIASKRGNIYGGHFTYNLVVGPTGLNARLQTNVNLDFLDLNDSAVLPDGKWHHAAVTYDAATGNGILYSDGKAVATGTKGTGLVAADPTLPFQIGSQAAFGQVGSPLTGHVAYVVAYDQVLTGAQVAGLPPHDRERRLGERRPVLHAVTSPRGQERYSSARIESFCIQR